MKNNLLFTVLVFLLLGNIHLHAQCYTQPNYCNPTFINVANYNIGIQNVSLGTLSNSSVATGNAPNYFNYTNISLVTAAGNPVTGTVTNGNSNSTTIRIFIDYNQDGVFSNIAPELAWSSATSTPNAVVAVSFAIPTGQAAGNYRMRVTGDIGGSGANPCSLTYGEVEDYSLILTSSSPDVVSNQITNPNIFIVGNNSISFNFFNLTNSTLSSIEVGYQLMGSSAVTQSLSSLSIAPGSLFSHTFSTQLNIAAIGTYNLKVWASNPNAAGNASPANDTLCRTFMVYCGSALSGSYTIDPAGGGPTNFKTFGAADSALMGCGVSGPVVFTVAAGTYNEQLELIAVSGSSATNTITFTGGSGNSSSRIISFAGTSGAPFTLRLNGCSYINYSYLTIRSLGTSDGWAAHLMNGTNNKFSNCVLEISGTGATAASVNLCPLVINGGAGIGATSTLSNNHTIENCTLNAGYYNIYCAGGNGNNILTFSNNALLDAHQYGIYVGSSITSKIKNNVINLRSSSSSSVGIYFINNNAAGANFHEISGNKITNAGQYGMYFLTSAGSGNAAIYGKIFNNFIGGGFRNTSGAYGINDNSNRYQIYHNSINMDVASTSGTTAAIYLNGGSFHDVQNNHLVVSNPLATNAFPVFSSAASNFSVLNNNNYYNLSSSYLISNGGLFSDYLNFKTTGGGTNSINQDPYFVSNFDLHTAIPCNKGANLTGTVSTDIDGNSRTNPPDIGADEATGLSNDIGILKINSPNFPLSAGSQNINVTIRNYGLNTITTATISYSVNGGAPVSQTWSGSLGTCDTANFTFTVAFNFGSGSNNLKVYTTAPNATADNFPANDTCQFTLCAALNGIYTIGSTGDFTSFTSATKALQCGGVGGPVTFNVQSGTYIEQISIGIIAGISATNSVVFQSVTGNPSDVNLTYSANTAANYTLRLNGVNFLKFRNLSISATNTSFGTALTFLNNASNDSFFNVTFNGVLTSSTSTNLAVIYTPVTVSNYISFTNCRIINGSYGVNIQSNSTNIFGASSQGTHIANCSFLNQYAYGIYNYNLDGVKLINNTIGTNSLRTSYVGIYNYWIMILDDASKPLVTGNKVYGGLGGHGIYNTYIGVNSSVSAARRALVANNMIQIGAGTNSTYGIRDQNGNGVDYLYNSVNITNTQNNTGSAAGFFNSTSYGSNSLINNVFASTSGAPALNISNNTFYPICNYNNLYTTGANLGHYNSIAQTTIAAWRAASGLDANSVNVNPIFTSFTDLHSNQPAMNNSAQVSALVTSDIDGQSRCPNAGCPGGTLMPDIGADEFIPTINDASIQAISAPTSICAGTTNVIVTLKNIGSAVLTSDSIQWAINGVVQPTFYWTGSLTQGSTASGVVIGSVTYSGGPLFIKVWSAYPNGVADENLLNDTTSIYPFILLNGTYTVGGASPDFPNFSAVSNALNTGGICGPVTFNVRQGTYSERIQLNSIPGSSASNIITIQPDPSNTTQVNLSIGGNSSAADNFTLFLNGTSYIKIKGINISNTSTGSGSFGSVVRFALQQDSVVFDSVNFVGPVTTNTSQNFAVLNHGSSTADTINKFSIRKCVIRNGSFGLYMHGNTSTTRFENKNSITDCKFLDNYYGGIYSRFQSNLSILNNTIALHVNSNINGYGLYLDYCDTFKIEKNYINGFGLYGIILSSANYQLGTGNAWSTIINNMIGGNHTNPSAFGIYFNSVSPQGSKYIRIYNNSISVISQAQGSCFYLQQTSSGMFDNLDIRNNSFANFGYGTYACYFYFNPAISNLTINNNNYFNNGSNLFTIGTSGYSNPTDGSPTYNANSKSGNPQYLNNFTNLHSVGTQLSDVGVNIAFVTNDIDDDTRPMSPSITTDIGADEYKIPEPNIGVSALVAPTCPMSSGLQNITVTIKNSGTTTLTTANVNYKVGINGTVKTTTFSGSLASGSTTNITFSGANQFNFTGILDTIISWTDSPNGLTDQYPANDTFTYYISSPLAGVYTLNASLPASVTNFQSFAALALALNNSGVSAPVTVNVAAGTYTEQIQINSICGASSINTITIDGGNGNVTTRILTYSGNYLNPHTLRLNTTNYLIIKNLRIQNTNPTYGWVVNFLNASNCQLKNCIVEFAGAASSSGSANLFGLLINNGTMFGNQSTATATSTNNTIDSCTFNYGYYQIYSLISNGANTNYFLRNTFTNAYQVACYFNGNQTIKLNYNSINTNASVNGNEGISLNGVSASGTNYHEISNNIIYAGYRGIYLGSSTGSATAMGQVYNNLIGGSFRNSSSYGIFISNSSRYNIWQNSINIDHTTTATSACIYSSGTSLIIDVRNNIFSVTNKLAWYTYCLFANSLTSYSVVDNNLYWNLSKWPLLSINSVLYTKDNFKSAFPTGGGVNSLRSRPTFYSNVNLHIKNTCRVGATLGVPDDIDFQTRGSQPDIGGDEIIPLTDNLMVDSIVLPPISSIPTLVQTVKVRVLNIGSNTVNNFNLSYSNNGGTPVTIPVSTPLAPCDTTTVTFSTVTFSFGMNTFKTYTDSPNGNTDIDKSDDTLTQNFCQPLNGTYTIGGSSPDFISFSQAVDVLNCGGISGPVVFNVRPGTYTERFSIESLYGSSTTNTVTFQSENGIASSVLLQYNVGGSYVADLWDADNVIFNKITIRNSSGGPVVNLRYSLPYEKCENITVRNCTISSTWGVGSNNAVINSVGDNKNLKIYGNTFSATSGIMITGNNQVGFYTSGIEIDSNNFVESLGSVFKPILLRYALSPKIRYNTVAKTGCCADYLMDIQFISGAMEISHNRMSTGGGQGVRVSYVNRNSETTYANVFNNFIHHSAASNNASILIDNCNYLNVVFNSINMVNVSSTSMAIQLTGSTAGLGYVHIKNNNCITNTGYGIYVNNTSALPMLTNGGSCNYNNYFNNSGPNVAHYNGVNYSSLTTFRGILYASPNNDLNSITLNPQYSSATDLHIANTSPVISQGQTIAGFTSDIDGKIRKASPDIGADEVYNKIRAIYGDYQVSASCPSLSGNAWIDIKDASGDLVFSINPNGNNLGATCWGIRISNAYGIRTDTTKIGTGGIKQFGYYLDRNFYITPTNTPTSAVSIRFYALNSELQELVDSVFNKYATSISFADIDVTKFSGDTIDLSPTNNGGDSTDYLLLNSAAVGFDTAWYLEINTNSFSEFNPSYTPGSPSSPLPIKLLTFTAQWQKEDALLKWVTATESNSDRFEVERSFDGLNFEKIGWKEAAGNSITNRFYSFIDPAIGLNEKSNYYYRIKLIDKDETWTLSGTRLLKKAKSNAPIEISAWPNPFSKDIKISVNITTNQTLKIIVTDLTGRILENFLFDAIKGNNQIQIPLENLAKGAYLLNLEAAGQPVGQQILIKE